MVVLAGAFDLASNIEEAKAIADAGGDTALVVVDTSAAYRLDDGEDDNTNSLAWARILRVMLGLNGKPAVLAATHPTKYAAADNLLPRGGSSFLNEVDGNLTRPMRSRPRPPCTGKGKFRGMTQLSPIQFALQSCERIHPGRSAAAILSPSSSPFPQARQHHDTSHQSEAARPAAGLVSPASCWPISSLTKASQDTLPPICSLCLRPDGAPSSSAAPVSMMTSPTPKGLGFSAQVRNWSMPRPSLSTPDGSG